eukprot:NODE_61_length_26588_cov_1.146778.p16 type:complete len:100 gc:universal NODE_61_length_26588_cov_1.146778:11202-11501(+)
MLLSFLLTEMTYQKDLARVYKVRAQLTCEQIEYVYWCEGAIGKLEYVYWCEGAIGKLEYVYWCEGAIGKLDLLKCNLSVFLVKWNVQVSHFHKLVCNRF